MNKSKGLTIIEVLVAISIFGIIVSLSVFSYQSWQRRVKLLNSTDNLKSTLTKAQQLSASSAQGSSWGIHLDSDNYVMFMGDSYNDSDPSNLIVNLKGVEILAPNTSISDGAGGYSSEIVFIKLSGETVNTGTIAIAPTYDITITQEINIRATGSID